MPKFYIGATPIGGVHDITKRTLDVIEKADYIVCELIHVVKTTAEQGQWKTNAEYLEYCYDFVGTASGQRDPNNKNHGMIKPEMQQIILDLVKQGKTMIYLPERGSVGVEDPGIELGIFLENNGVDVEYLPGVSSVIASLIVSKIFPTDASNRAFTFQPLVDLEGEQLEKMIMEYKDSRNMYITQIHDPEMLDGLKLMLKHYGPNRRISICADVSLSSEEVFHGTLQEIIDNFDPKKYHNRYTTIVVEGVNKPL